MALLNGDTIVMHDTDHLSKVRLKVSSEKEWKAWFKEFCKGSNTSWNVRKTYPRLQKLRFRKDYVCQYNRTRSKELQKLNTQCPAKLIVKIRLITTSTKKRDRMISHFPCIVIFKEKHNHPLASRTALKQLKSLHTTEEKESNIHLRHHKAVLTRMCRICGTHCNDLKAYSAVHFTSTFAEDAKALGVDTSDDDPLIHPASMCKKCIGEVSKRNDKEQASTPAECYQFEPHEGKECEICKYPCSACLLVPASAPLEGNLLHYKTSDEQAVKERHRHLMKSIIQLTSKLAPVKCKTKALPANNTEEHSSPCMLCDAPCPLCGMTLKDASGSFLIRCKVIAASTRVLRARKRKIPVYDDEKETEVLKTKSKKPDKTVPSKDVAILPKIKPNNTCLIHRPSMLTFTGHDGRTYKVPVVSNAKPAASENDPLSHEISQTPVFSQVNQMQAAADPVEIPTKAATKPIAPVKNVNQSNPPYRPISTRTSLPFKPAQSKPKYTTHNVVVQGKSVTKRSVEFGMAPRTVAKTFHDLYKKHCSLTACIRQALAMAPLLKYKYKFVNPTLASEQCILIGVLSDRDTDAEVNFQLQRLDRFVKENHLASRASAIEELLYSPLQNIGQKALEDGLTKSEGSTSTAPTFSSDNNLRLKDYVGEQTSEQNNQQDKTYFCDPCKKTFITIQRYNRHCDSSSHKLAVFTAKEAKADAEKMKDDGRNGEAPFSKRKVTRNYSELLHQSYNSVSLSIDTPMETAFKCYICLNQVTGQLRFMRHLWKHRNSLRFPCTWCGRNFNSAIHMRQHIMKKSCMKDLKQGASSSSSSEPTKLHRLTGKYTGIVPHHYKPFTMQKLQGDETVSVAKCKFCPFVSKDVMAIVCHGRKHVGDYPFRCSKCLYCAVSKAKLVAHQKASGHEGFYVIKRSYPLNAVEVEKLNTMVRRKLIIYNEKGCLEPSASSNKEKGDSEEEDVEEEDGHSPARASDKGSWNFCKLCNSAFLDKATYDSHMKHCGQTAGAWLVQEQDTAEDEECSEEEIDFDKIVPGLDQDEADAPVDEESSQSEKLSTLDRILAKSSSANPDIQDARDVDSMAGISTERPLIVASDTNRKQTRKMKPQKRNRLLDVIAGLSAVSSGHQKQNFAFPDIPVPEPSNSTNSPTSPTDSLEDDLVTNDDFSDQNVEVSDPASPPESLSVAHTDGDHENVKDLIELSVGCIKEENLGSLNASASVLKDGADNGKKQSDEAETMEVEDNNEDEQDNNEDEHQDSAGIAKIISMVKKEELATSDSDKPFPHQDGASGVSSMENGPSLKCDGKEVGHLNLKHEQIDRETLVEGLPSNS